jgi:hypothetical protein
MTARFTFHDSRVSPLLGMASNKKGDRINSSINQFCRLIRIPTDMQRTYLAILALILFSCKKEDDEIRLTVYKGAGDITATMNDFRTALGNLNTSPGATSGRREINWDTVADSLLNKTLPADFFNPTTANAPIARQRGLLYEGGAVQVSNNGFADINNEASSEFSSFSGTKSFANVTANKWEIGFEVAGQTTAASVSGFGMVFTDVDKDNTTSLEFFDGVSSIGKFFVPPHNATNPYSFLGVYFHNKKITKVSISHQGTLSNGGKDISQGGTNDLVVMDDVIYGEPAK